MLAGLLSPSDITIMRTLPRLVTWPCLCSRDGNAPCSLRTSTSALLGTVGAVRVAPPVVTSWHRVSSVETDLFGVVIPRRGRLHSEHASHGAL